MKKYSTNAPLIFGVIFLIVGIVLGQIPVILLFGVLPIVASILIKWSDHKAKMRGEETSTQRAERIFRAAWEASENKTQAKKPCCARCGVDLSLLSPGQIKKIGDKQYCDMCGQILLKTPKVEPQTKKTAEQHFACARCKRILSESEAEWIGNHRFCRDCARGHTVVNKPVDTQKGKHMQTQRLVSALGQIQEVKKEQMLSDTCVVCRRPLPGKKRTLIDGEYYCEDCYSFTFNKGHKENIVLAEELYQISYEISGLPEHSPHWHSVEIADRLVVGGFKFHTASVGGGVDEISHSGVKAYNAVYTDYDDFKNNMERDHQKREQEERENSGGLISTLDYSHICVFLSRKTLKVCVIAEDDHVVFRWIDTSDKYFAVTRVFAEKAMEEIYGNKCILKQIDNVQLHSAFLSNWRETESSL